MSWKRGATRGTREGARPSRRQENLRATSERARLARQRAQAIFLSMIEGPVSPQVFVAQARYLNPEVYSDVVSERALVGLCGYPVCPNNFTDTYGRRSYVIRNNHLYDITERRNFCSNVCYEASQLVRQQVLKLPLYLRDSEDPDIKDMRLPDLSRLKGQHGKLKDLTGGMAAEAEGEEEEEKPWRRRDFKATDEIALESLVNWSENEADNSKGQNKESDNTSEINDNLNESKPEKGTIAGTLSEKEEINCTVSNLADDLGHNLSTPLKDDFEGKNYSDARRKSKNVGKVKKMNNDNTSLCNTQKEKGQKKDGVEGDSKPEKEADQKHESGEDQGGGQHAEDQFAEVYMVEGAMREWVSFDSLRVVLGDKYVRGMLEHLGHTWDNYDSTSGLRLSVEAKARYIAICRKLDHEERAEERELQQSPVDHHKDEAPIQHPLPDYQQLQKQAKNQQLKVVSFLGGSDQYEEENEPLEERELETIAEEATPDGGGAVPTAKKRGTRKPKSKKTSDVDIEGATLPFIDSYSQAAWRQNIVEEKINSYVQQLVGATKLSGHELRRLLSPLVATFHLSPHNISFRPKQWRLISLILLKMLSVRYPVIQEAMRGEEGLGIQRTILSAFSLDFDYCDRMLSYLTEIKHVISKDFKGGEVEKTECRDNTEGSQEACAKGECAETERAKGAAQDDDMQTRAVAEDVP